jgi:hypothetical protein
MAYKYLIYRTDIAYLGTVVRESRINNPGVNEASLYSDFIYPAVQPIFFWRVVGITVIPNTNENITAWSMHLVPPTVVITGATNLGTGTTIYTGISHDKLDLRSLKGVGGISISNNANEIILSASTDNKFSFGNIVAKNLSYPVTNGTSIDSPFGNKFFKYIQQYYDDYSKFLFDIYVDNENNFVGQQFPTKNDMVAFLNANLINHSGQVNNYIINCYAKESPALPTINKIYGMNFFYSVLKGRHNYKRKIREFYSGGYVNYLHNNDLVVAAWDFYMGGGFIQPPNYENGARGMWLTQTQSNIYGLLYSGDTIDFTSGIGGNRMAYNLITSKFEAQGTTTMTVVDSFFIGLQAGTRDFQIFGRKIKDNIYYQPYSFIKIYKLVGKNAINEDIVALLIKPVGQDTFRLNYIPNINNKDLYAIYYEGDNDHQPLVKRLTNAVRHNDIVGDVSFLIAKTDWCVIPQLASGEIIKHIGRSRMKKIRFFFGDAQGNISSFSPEITPFIFVNGAKMITLISKI